MSDPAILNRDKSTAVRQFFERLDSLVEKAGTDQAQAELDALQAKRAKSAKSDDPQDSGAPIKSIDSIIQRFFDAEIVEGKTFGHVFTEFAGEDWQTYWKRARADLEQVLERKLTENKDGRVSLRLFRELVKIEENKIFDFLTPSSHPSQRIESGADLSKDLFYVFRQGRAVMNLIIATKALTGGASQAIESAIAGESVEGHLEGLKKDAFDQFIPQALASVDQLGVYYAKLAQTFSTFAYLFSEEAYKKFGHLQNKLARNMPVEKVHRIVEEDLGAPLESLYVEFEPTPFASGSIAQLHRAKIRTRRGKIKKVVVKVLKESVIEELGWNIRVNDAVFKYFKEMSDEALWVDFLGQQFEALGHSFLRETDFPAEARRMERWHTLFWLDKGISVPKAYGKLCGRRVITMDEVENASTSDFASRLKELAARKTKPEEQAQAPSQDPAQPQAPAEPARPARLQAPAEPKKEGARDSADPGARPAFKPKAEDEKTEKENEMDLSRIFKDLVGRYGYKMGPQYMEFMRGALPYAAISFKSKTAADAIRVEDLSAEELAELKAISKRKDTYDRAFWTQMLYLGEVHADLQPANILQNDQGIHIIDLGTVVRTRGLIFRPYKLVSSFVRGDAVGIVKALEKMGSFGPGVKRSEVVTFVQSMLNGLGIKPRNWRELFKEMFSGGDEKEESGYQAGPAEAPTSAEVEAELRAGARAAKASATAAMNGNFSTINPAEIKSQAANLKATSLKAAQSETLGPALIRGMMPLFRGMMKQALKAPTQIIKYKTLDAIDRVRHALTPKKKRTDRGAFAR